jgi:hypothetical protein
MRCERTEAGPNHPRAGAATHDEETHMQRDLGEPRLVALFAAGVLLLNFPLLALWDRETTVGGLPLFPLALFVLWGALIALLAWILESIDD